MCGRAMLSRLLDGSVRGGQVQLGRHAGADRERREYEEQIRDLPEEKEVEDVAGDYERGCDRKRDGPCGSADRIRATQGSQGGDRCGHEESHVGRKAQHTTLVELGEVLIIENAVD